MISPREPQRREREETGVLVEPAPRAWGAERIAPMWGVLILRDLARWGPVWAGFFAVLGTVVLLRLLGAAVGLGTLGFAALPNLASPTGVWEAIVVLVGLFIGGWLAARLSAVGGHGLGLIHGVLVWALTLTLSVVFTAVGLGPVLGVILGALSPTVGAFTIAVALTARQFAFGVLLIGLVVAALGGWIGARSMTEAPPR